MDVFPLDICDVKLLVPRRFEDHRGFFSELYSKSALKDLGIDANFIQDNLSLSTARGTIRGLHFQRPPHAQTKLVTVLTGRVLDVAVDCRRGSPTFGRHIKVELSAQSPRQLYIPRGFAHGFCTIEPNTTVLYKVDALYAPASESGVLWNDPDLSIRWPITEDQAILSNKDKELPRLRDLDDVFAKERD